MNDTGASPICKTKREVWAGRPDGKWCPNMKPRANDTSMESESYECAVCGQTIKLYYDDMR